MADSVKVQSSSKDFTEALGNDNQDIIKQTIDRQWNAFSGIKITDDQIENYERIYAEASYY